MDERKEATVWTLQQFTHVAGRPWYALQEHSDAGVVRQFTGYRHELEKITERLGAPVEELPTITEEEFFAQCST